MEAEIEDLDECVNRKIVVNLIHEIAFLLIGKKGLRDILYKGSSYSFESFEESDLVEIIEVREKKAIPHKQRKKDD